MKFVLKLLLTCAVASAGYAYDKTSRKAIAKAFCGGKYSIPAQNPTGFLLKCRQDEGLFSAVVDINVLYTIYSGRPSVPPVRRVEVVMPDSERWQMHVEGYQKSRRKARPETVVRSALALQ